MGQSLGTPALCSDPGSSFWFKDLTTWKNEKSITSTSKNVKQSHPLLTKPRGSVMWGQGVYGAQILVLVHKFTFKVVFGVIFSHTCRLSLLLNIQIENSDNFDPQFLKLAPPLTKPQISTS